jgi:hypothetical protein
MSSMITVYFDVCVVLLINEVMVAKVRTVISDDNSVIII